jgi:drug/metabolite transporter (DMT)-like permease
MARGGITKAMGAKEWGLLLFLSLLWGGSFFFYKILVAALPPVTVVLGRVGMAAIALNLWLVASGGPAGFPLAQWKRFLLLGFLNNVAPFILIAWGETRIDSGLASIINATTPIFTVLVAHWMTEDEKLSVNTLIGMACGFIGVAVLIGPSAFGGATASVGGELAVLAAALVYGFGGTYGRRFRGTPPLQVAAGQTTAATLVLLPMSLVIDRPWELPAPAWPVWAAWLAIALISTALAYVVFYKLLATAGVTNIVLVTLLLPINALLLGAMFLNEQVTFRALAGMALIALGLAAIDGRLLARLWPPRRNA